MPATPQPAAISAAQSNAPPGSRSAQSAVLPAQANAAVTANTIDVYPVPIPTGSANVVTTVPPTLSTAVLTATVIVATANQGISNNPSPERPVLVASPAQPTRMPSSSPVSAQIGSSTGALNSSLVATQGSPISGAAVGVSSPIRSLSSREIELASDVPAPTTRAGTTPLARTGPGIAVEGTSVARSGGDVGSPLLIRTPRPFGDAIWAPGSVAWTNDPDAAGLSRVSSTAPQSGSTQETRTRETGRTPNAMPAPIQASTAPWWPSSFTSGHMVFVVMSLGLLGLLAISTRTR